MNPKPNPKPRKIVETPSINKNVFLTVDPFWSVKTPKQTGKRGRIQGDKTDTRPAINKLNINIDLLYHI